MTNDTEIRPVLTPEEWESARATGLRQTIFMGLTGVERRLPDGRIKTAIEPEQVMALANAALPDTDPRKFTRDDVTWLRQLADSADVEPGWGHDAGVMRELAARIAALLPPN